MVMHDCYRVHLCAQIDLFVANFYPAVTMATLFQRPPRNNTRATALVGERALLVLTLAWRAFISAL